MCLGLAHFAARDEPAPTGGAGGDRARRSPYALRERASKNRQICFRHQKTNLRNFQIIYGKSKNHTFCFFTLFANTFASAGELTYFLIIVCRSTICQEGRALNSWILFAHLSKQNSRDTYFDGYSRPRILVHYPIAAVVDGHIRRAVGKAFGRVPAVG